MDFSPPPTAHPYSGGEYTFRQRAPSTPAADEAGSSRENEFNANFQAQLGHMVWDAGTKKVTETFNSYGKIDHFRPYFDVEPKQVRNRLLQAFIPRKPSQVAVTNDLYGPTMIVLTLVALLLFGMKSSGYIVQSGTLMGTAMFTCFGAWIGLGVGLSTLGFLFGTDVPLVHVLSLFGYSMTSHCVVVALTSIFHPTHSHLFFLILTGLFCIPAALRVSLYIASHTREKTHKLIITVAILAAHILYAFYLHFGFHVMLEEIDEMLGDTTNHLAAAVVDTVTVAVAAASAELPHGPPAPI